MDFKIDEMFMDACKSNDLKAVKYIFANHRNMITTEVIRNALSTCKSLEMYKLLLEEKAFSDGLRDSIYSYKCLTIRQWEANERIVSMLIDRIMKLENEVKELRK